MDSYVLLHLYAIFLTFLRGQDVYGSVDTKYMAAQTDPRKKRDASMSLPLSLWAFP